MRKEKNTRLVSALCHASALVGERQGVSARNLGRTK